MNTIRLINTIRTGWTITLRSIRIQTREHIFGYAWTLIIPMLYAICYIFIKRELISDSNIQSAGLSWDVLRAFVGIMLFQCWMQVVQDMSEMIRRQRGMLRGLNIGPAPFVLAIVFEGMIALIIRTALIIAAIQVLNIDLPSTFMAWMWFLICLLGLNLSATAVGLLLAPWSALYADVRKALRSIGMPLVLISPIFYPAVERSDSMLYWVNIINPLAPSLAVMSDALQDKVWSFYLLPMLVWGMLSIVSILWSLSQLRSQMPILLERMEG
jgi:ABC-type polysaccharide/polyol phosphate export permease